jgi:hypothetical protein
MPQKFASDLKRLLTLWHEREAARLLIRPSKGGKMKHRPTETPFLVKRGGVFYESYALQRVTPLHQLVSRSAREPRGEIERWE